MSLPQPIRSPAEALRFQKGLKALMSWYSHPYTHTLLLTTQLPTGGAYKSLRPYAERGWCETERRVSGVSKCTHCLWDLAGFAPERLVGLEGMHAFDELRSQLRGGRSPPLAPDRFAALVRHKVDAGELVFTAEADVEVVLQMYATGFVRVFDAYRRFDPQGFFAAFAGQGWGEAEAKQVAAALAYAAERCPKGRTAQGGLSLRFEGNHFGPDGKRAIQRAVQSSRHFESVIF